MAEKWYAIRSKPNREDFLWGQLVARNVETYYPKIRVQPVNPRARKVQPYFPGYMFVHLDFSRVSPSSLHWMPGAVGMVSFDGLPSSVPEELVVAIRKRVEQENAAMKARQTGFVPGDEIKVHSGPFAGYEAIFDSSLSGNDRVRVLLKMLNNRQMMVDLSSRDIYRKNLSRG